MIGKRPGRWTVKGGGVTTVEAPRRLTMGLTYYAPYVSGLTNAAKVVAEELSLRGWQVTVVAAQHDPELPRREVINGVRVIRVPVLARLSKGVVAPMLPFVAAREIRRSGVGNLHLPMPEAGAVAALLGRKSRLVTTYQCDVTLPESAGNRAIEMAIDTSSRLAVRRSEVVAVTSLDYLSSSRLAARITPKAIAVAAPSLPRAQGTPTFRQGSGPHIGFLGRIVEEKGIPYLVRAFRSVAGEDWRLLVGGDFEQVAGGSVVDEVRRAAEDDHRILLLGFIPEDRIADLYASMDVFAFPSVNPLEAFGIAQVEAMLAGIPVVASGLPGVRQPILKTGFGKVVPPRDVEKLGEALLELVNTPKESWRAPEAEARRVYALDSILDQWESVFRGEASHSRGPLVQDAP